MNTKHFQVKNMQIETKNDPIIMVAECDNNKEVQFVFNMIEVDSQITKCANCGKSGKKFWKCKSCWILQKKAIYYCTRHCQKVAWGNHHTNCMGRKY